MPQCPSCGTELGSDFGMVACPKCHAISVIDLDGNIQLDELPVNIAEPVTDPSEQPLARQLLDELTEQSPNGVAELPVNIADPVTDPPDEEMFREVSDFANSTVSQGRDGLLVFDLVVSGIDSRELREAVRESITDRRFMWDVREVMAGINDGKLVLKGINAIKATVLINRLKGLPLELHWQQNSIIS